MRPWEKILTVLLTLAILGAIGSLSYLISKPKIRERFTEFYLLGPEGKAEDYPQEIPLGGEGSVILGIVNQEHELTEYRVIVNFDQENVADIGPITLNDGEKSEQEIDFAPKKPGLNQKVEFLLYKGISTEPYRALYLWIDVKGKS